MTDVALLSLASTRGLRQSDDALADVLVAAGVSCAIVRVKPGLTWRLRRHIALTDLVEGIAARRAMRAAGGARAVIVSGATTALLLPRPPVPWALRFDSPTALNRPGIAGAWQRARERRVLPRADLLLPTGEAAARAAAPLHAGVRTVTVPIPIEVPAVEGPRSDEVVAYGGWLSKRGIDVLCEAWRLAAPEGARLVIGGCDPDAAVAWLGRRGVAVPPGVEWTGLLAREEWLARVGRARCFVNVSRREDYGIAQLEALALGTPLVTVPSPGAYEALPLARRLAPGLVAADGTAAALAGAIRAGLAFDDPGFAPRAAAALAPYRRDAVLEIVRRDVLPALGL